MKAIGIYGGTYNPPHLGHVRSAVQALKTLELEFLYMIPTGISPHKVLPEGSATASQRLRMLELAAREEPGIRVSDVEIRREGASYTWQTVQTLAREHPGRELVLLMGTDMFLSFLTWKKPEQILEQASLGVFYRGLPGEEPVIRKQKAVLEALGARVYLLENDVTAISSTDLRRMLILGGAEEYLAPGVLEFIHSASIYGTGASYKGLPEDRLEQVVCSLLDPKRIPHVLGCRDTAVALAKRWDADEHAALRAGLLHDVTKALSGTLQYSLCRSYGLGLVDLQGQDLKTLHALTGSCAAERIFGESPEVVRAICYHTTGRANMSTLEKIIYVADYMEPNRDFPGVEDLRRLAYSDLDQALKLGLEMTVTHLNNQGKEVCAASRQALQWLNTNS